MVAESIVAFTALATTTVAVVVVVYAGHVPVAVPLDEVVKSAPGTPVPMGNKDAGVVVELVPPAPVAVIVPTCPVTPLEGLTVMVDAAKAAGGGAIASTTAAVVLAITPARSHRDLVVELDLRMRGPPTVSVSRIVGWVGPAHDRHRGPSREERNVEYAGNCVE
jgi:hypothetical protein